MWCWKFGRMVVEIASRSVSRFFATVLLSNSLLYFIANRNSAKLMIVSVSRLLGSLGFIFLLAIISKHNEAGRNRNFTLNTTDKHRCAQLKIRPAAQGSAELLIS